MDKNKIIYKLFEVLEKTMVKHFFLKQANLFGHTYQAHLKYMKNGNLEPKKFYFVCALFFAAFYVIHLQSI